MTLILRQNVVCQPTAAPVQLDRRRRRLSSIAKRHAPKGRPYIVSLHRKGDLLKPEDHTVRLRKTWSHTLVGPNDIVVITQLPLGGGGGGDAKQIGAAVAMIALVLVAAVVAGPIAGTLGLTAGTLGYTAATAAIQAGIVMGGGYLVSLATQAKANNPDDRPVYGVAGGTNVARPGDRIPVGYGHFWSKPDLAQPDYTVYDGEDQVLYKRMTLGLGKYQVHKIQIGTATLWNEDDGVVSPFSSAPGGGGSGQIGSDSSFARPGSGGGSEVEIVAPGAACTLVPDSVYSSPSVGGTELPRPADIPAFQGPFVLTPVGKETDTIQLDFSFPEGVYHQAQTHAGIDAHTAHVLFEYAPCDADDNPTGAYTTLYEYNQSLKTTRAQRFTRIITVTKGRYLVRGKNLIDQFEDNSNHDTCTWDGLRAHFTGSVVHDNATDIAIKVRSGKNLGVTAFGEVYVEATRILPVWNGSAWVDTATRKAVYAYKDILQSEYGGNLPDNEVDLEGIKARASSLTSFDTFDGIIRGPVSVWDACCTVLGTIRGEPARIGNTWSINRDEARDVKKHVFTRRQIRRGSTSASWKIARDDGAADVVVEYSPDCDPRRRNEVRTTYGTESLTPRRVQLQGVSDWDHAKHLSIWLAAVAYYRRKRRKIAVEYQGRIVRRGDPVFIDAWWMSSHKAAGILERTGFDVSLDTDAVFADNLVLNGNFANGGTGWIADVSASGSAVAYTNDGLGGTKCAKLIHSSGSATITNATFIPVNAETDYQVSVYTKGNAAATGLTVLVNWFNSSNGLISTVGIYSNAAVTTGFKRSSHLLTSPAGAASCKFTIGLAPSASVTTLYIDSVDLHLASEADTYALFRDRKGREWGPVLVTAGDAPNRIVLDETDVAAAEAAADLTLDVMLAHSDEDMTSVLIGPYPDDPYLINSVQPQGKSNIAIEALYDAPEVYTALGDALPAEPTVPSRGDEVEPDIATLAWVKALCQQKGVGLAMDWAISGARGAASYVVQLSYDDGETWEPVSGDLSTSGTYPIRHVDGATLKIGAYAISRSGNVGPAVYATFSTYLVDITGDNSRVSISATVDALRQRVTADIQAMQDRIDRIRDDLAQSIGEHGAVSEQQSRNVSSVMGPLSASVTEFILTYASDQGALANYKLTVQAQFDNVDADIGDVSDAVASVVSDFNAFAGPGGTFASYQTTVTASFDDMQAAVDINVDAIADINGNLAAKYSLVVDSDGFVSSMELIAGGGSSAVRFLTGAFQIAISGDSGSAIDVFTAGLVGGSPAIVIDAPLFADEVFIKRMVDDDQISYEKLETGAASASGRNTHAQIGIDTVLTANTWTNLFGATINTKTGNVEIRYATRRLYLTRTSTTPNIFTNGFSFRIKVDGTVATMDGSADAEFKYVANQISSGNYLLDFPIALPIVTKTGLSVGSHTVSVEVKIDSTFTGGTGSLLGPGVLKVEELRKPA